MTQKLTEEELLELARRYSFRSRIDSNGVAGPIMVWGRGPCSGLSHPLPPPRPNSTRRRIYWTTLYPPWFKSELIIESCES